MALSLAACSSGAKETIPSCDYTGKQGRNRYTTTAEEKAQGNHSRRLLRFCFSGRMVKQEHGPDFWEDIKMKIKVGIIGK